MKSAILKSNIFGVLGFAALGFTTAASTVASARPDVCDYDCKGHSKTRVACGLKITWKSQSIKWCDTIDLPKMWACESVRSSACRIGERLEESGAEGPKLHYEKFQMMPYKKLFSNSDNVAVNISLLSRSVDYFNVQMMNANGFNAGFNKTLRTADEDSNVIVEQLQALSDWAKWGGIVCSDEDYANLKNNMPFYYLKQIPLADFCKKRWQHLSNNWANGFERNRSRASCEATWGMQGIEQGPLAFTCANRNNSFANLGRYVETETAPDYKDYLDSTTASISKFMRMVNWNETNEVKEAHKLVSDAESSLFANQMKSQMFDSQLNEINRQITAEEAYKKEVEARLSRIMGFVESYKSFIESESVKIDGMEIKFTDTLANLKVLLSDRNIKLASLSTYVSALSKSAEGVVTEETLTQLPQLQATYEALQNNQYQTLCVSKELKEQVSRLQAIQAYRIDLADRLVSSVEYFEDSAEFNDAKVKFTAQAEKLSGQVSEKNYVFNPSFAILINKPEVCQKFDNARAILDTLRESAANSGSSSDIKNVRNLFQVRLTALKAQQALLVQKTKVRNQVYSIMKDLEDNFNSGYLTQLYQDQVTARSRILAASDYAKSFLQGEELKSLQEIINQKLTYFDQRSPVYTNLQQGRFKLQTRLNRFVNEVAEFKDQANDQELGAIASDVESFLPVVFRYNPNQVTAQIPAVENVNELSGLDSFLSDVEQRFTAIKELSK